MINVDKKKKKKKNKRIDLARFIFYLAIIHRRLNVWCPTRLDMYINIRTIRAVREL